MPLEVAQSEKDTLSGEQSWTIVSEGLTGVEMWAQGPYVFATIADLEDTKAVCVYDRSVVITFHDEVSETRQAEVMANLIALTKN